MSKAEDFYEKIPFTSHKGTEEQMRVHPVLYSLVKGGLELMRDKRHFFILITGNVGDGKSNLAAILAHLWEYYNGSELDFDNIVWTSNKFVEKTDREDNKRKCIWWDEAITGASGKKMAITKEGEMLKIALVTKRFKQHFYILIVDEIEEYSWKLIKMCNAWFHVHTKYRERGYFKGFLSKKKIKTIYQAFKYYKWDWDRVTISPDVAGKFDPYIDLILGDKEYDEKKLEETKQTKQKQNIYADDTTKSEKVIEMLQLGLKPKYIMEKLEVSDALVYKIRKQLTKKKASIN